jgi:hypothetical protein
MKIFPLGPSCSTRTGRQTGMTKLTVAFCNLQGAKIRKQKTIFQRINTKSLKIKTDFPFLPGILILEIKGFSKIKIQRLYFIFTSTTPQKMNRSYLPHEIHIGNVIIGYVFTMTFWKTYVKV